MSDKPQRAAEIVGFFEDVVRGLTATRGDDDPFDDIVDKAFAAVHARYGDLTAAEAERAAAIRQHNAYAALFELAHGRLPNTVEELYRWLATPEGCAAYRRAGRTP
jgi:hypothetical protein